MLQVETRMRWCSLTKYSCSPWCSIRFLAPKSPSNSDYIHWQKHFARFWCLCLTASQRHTSCYSFWRPVHSRNSTHIPWKTLSELSRMSSFMLVIHAERFDLSNWQKNKEGKEKINKTSFFFICLAPIVIYGD